MRLHDAARYFDDDQVLDAYTSAFLFNAQMISPAEHVSGDTFRRHTLSAGDGHASPARGAVRVMGDVWMLGDNNPDGFKGSVLRRNYSLKRATGLLNLRTPAQACLGTAGTAMYAYKEFYHDMIDNPTESEYDTLWNVYCALNESVSKGSFFVEGSTVFRVRNSYRTVEGFNLAETDQFDADAVQAAVFITTGTLNLVTDKYPTASIATTVIQTDVFKFYRFRTEVEASRKPGDLTVFVAKSALTPAVGGNFTMQGSTWRITSVVSEIDAWVLHARRA